MHDDSFANAARAALFQSLGMPGEPPLTAREDGAPPPELLQEAPSSSPMDNVPPVDAPPVQEGTHPLAVSPEEGFFAVTQDAIVSQLNKLLKLKYTTAFAYINYGDRIRAHFRDVIAEHFKDHREEELADAYHLTMKITALGGEPTPKVGTIIDTADMHQIFLALLDLEKKMLKEFRALAALAGDNLSLKVMLEEMVLKDQQHADDLRRMMFCETNSPIAGEASP